MNLRQDHVGLHNTALRQLEDLREILSLRFQLSLVRVEALCVPHVFVEQVGPLLLALSLSPLQLLVRRRQVDDLLALFFQHL